MSDGLNLSLLHQYEFFYKGDFQSSSKYGFLTWKELGCTKIVCMHTQLHHLWFIPSKMCNGRSTCMRTQLHHLWHSSFGSQLLPFDIWWTQISLWSEWFAAGLNSTIDHFDMLCRWSGLRIRLSSPCPLHECRMWMVGIVFYSSVDSTSFMVWAWNTCVSTCIQGWNVLLCYLFNYPVICV